MSNKLYTGDAKTVLATLPENSVQLCVTSPPYYNLREYKKQAQIGQEGQVADYIENLFQVFFELYRVIKPDGLLFLNLGDCYKNGILGGIPWRVALDLHDNTDWILRSDIIWAKTNPMPSSVKNRPTSSHEYIFMFSKSLDYYYNNEAIMEPLKYPKAKAIKFGGDKYPNSGETDSTYSGNLYDASKLKGRNKRDVWQVSTGGFKGGHFAAYPKKLIEPCILAGSREGDIIIDPFNGSGTTGVVAIEHKRQYIGIDINEEYVKISQTRIEDETNETIDILPIY